MKKACGSSHISKDRISHLPEPIRSKVLSFLPMEDAIRTSILSKEWRWVTASLPNLEFDQDAIERKNYSEDQFRIFVDRLLVSRDRVDVGRFSLNVRVNDEWAEHQISAWILFAIRNNVQEFHLHHILGGSPFNLKFFDCFFQCRSLTELSLSNLHFKVPTNVCFPSLRRFNLFFVTIYDDNLTDSNLFSSCPVIENLTLDNCPIDSRGTYTISSPTLRTLKFEGAIPSTEIKIHAKNLQQIEYSHSRPPTMSSETLSSLLRADFKLGARTVGFTEILDLIWLQNIVRLSLRGLYIEAISRRSIIAFIPSYSTLKHLELEISHNWRHVEVVIKFLTESTNLVTLCVSFPTTKSTNVPDLYMYSPNIISRHLQSVELKNFGGTKEDLHIVRYLLENASGLEKMKINYLDALKKDATARLMVSEELLTITKASSRATVFFN